MKNNNLSIFANFCIDTEVRIMETIKSLFYNKTSITVVSRRLSLINCNKIFSIENGEIK